MLHKLEIHQINVKIMFLNGELDEEIYTETSESKMQGFESSKIT